jgi:hypothetical protein
MNGAAGQEDRRTGHKSVVVRGGSVLVAIISGLMMTGTPTHGETAAPAAQRLRRADDPRAQSANDRMLEPGPELLQPARRVGTWNVVMTIRPTADGRPLRRSG